MENRYNLKARIVGVVVVMLMVFGLFSLRLIKLQIVEGADYLAQSQKRVASKSVITAPRGEISDRLGRPFVTNSDTKIITLEKGLIKDDKLNDEILELIKVFEAAKDNYIDTLPITKTKPYAFSTEQNPDESTDKVISELLKRLKLSKDASAESVMQKLTEKYKLQNYSDTDRRKIAGVRNEMELRNFSDSNSYTFAEDVNIQSVTLLKEKSDMFPGLSVDLEPVRQFVTPGIASHILGRIGKIYAEEYPALKEKGYSLNDTVGKDGIEKSCEQYLKGINGTKKVERDINGNITSIIESKAAVPGNNVYLTLDKDLQTVAEESLARTIPQIAATHVGKEGADANVGAAVAVDVNTGDILALASYPTYNLSTFNDTYSALLKDKLKPMYNRAIAGLYEPGSTFKMVTAIAGLESGKITPTSTYTCTGKYRRFSTYQPTCYHGEVHGTINVVSALEHSCNIFFFETGYQTTIEVMNKYAKMLGLGGPTGIELSGEAKGNLAGKETRKAKGQVWNPGDTIQAAIGQSDNLFTPIQLASYISTIANGGTRYQLHLVKSVKSYYTSETVLDNQPKVLDKLTMKPENYQAVIEGLKRVIKTGTAEAGFRDLAIPVAGKTGTAEVAKGSANGVFVGFAPADKPQIAVVVVIEHAGLGANIAPVAKDIFTTYFAAKQANDKIQQEGILLG